MPYAPLPSPPPLEDDHDFSTNNGHPHSHYNDTSLPRVPTANSLTLLTSTPRSKHYHHARRASIASRFSLPGGWRGAGESTPHTSRPYLSRPPWSPSMTHTLISIAAGTVMTLFGYEQGVFGGIIIGSNFQEYFSHPSPSMTGFVTSVYDLGCFAGAVGTLFVGERLGRKNMLLLGTVVMAAGIVVQTGAHSMSHLLWGRFIAGVGNGGNTATAPVWHVETAEREMKGKAVVKEMVVNVAGFVTSNVITLAFSGVGTEAQWRFPLGIQLLYCVVILGLVPLLPESPRWLCARGRDLEAREVLEVLSEGDVEGELREIRESVRAEQAVQVGWLDLFRGGTATRRMLLGMGLQVAQQLTGINVLCYYLPLVLTKSVGLASLPARLLATGNSICFMLAVAACLLFIERFGRRPLLIGMAAAQAVAFLGIAISTEIGHENGAHIPGIVATVFISIFFVAFGCGWAPIPWLYPAEVNSLSMRTKGAALATACDWLFNYVVVQTTPIGIHYLQWGLYLVYAVLNASFVPLIYWFVVETAGKSLEQIDRWFAANPGWFVTKDMETRYIEVQDDDERDIAQPLKESDVQDFASGHGNGYDRTSSEGKALWRIGNDDDEDDEDAEDAGD